MKAAVVITWGAMMTALFAAGNPDAPDLSHCDMETLIGHAQQYGNTQARKRWRSAAQAELLGRGTNAFHFFFGKFHLQNMTIRMMADEMVRKTLDDEVAADALLFYLDHPDEMTRKSAAYYLGFCETPQHADAVLPLLDDGKAAGAAMRTLGKWGSSNAVPGIVAQIMHKDERRRILAVNALADIGDPSAIPALAGALADERFTVRKCARDALVSMGAQVLPVGMQRIGDAPRVAQREWIDVLAAVGGTNATHVLESLREQVAESDRTWRQELDSALERLRPVF